MKPTQVIWYKNGSNHASFYVDVSNIRAIQPYMCECGGSLIYVEDYLGQPNNFLCISFHCHEHALFRQERDSLMCLNFIRILRTMGYG